VARLPRSLDQAQISQQCRAAPSPALLKGIEEFNQRRFFECHETLEDLWTAEHGPVRYLYQGILQVGVAFYHLSRRNWHGAVTMLRSGQHYLEIGRAHV
jgi:predicted metal-dependent hydrolase